MKNILTVMKKELRRFLGDRRMLATLVLPGILIYVVYSLMGSAFSDVMGGTEDMEYRVLTHNLSPTVATITEQSGLNITYVACTDCAEEHSPEAIAESINEGGYHAYLVFPENFDESIATYDPALGLPAPEVKIYYNSSDADSATAYSTLLALLDALESSMTNRFDVNMSQDVTFDVASEEDVTGMLFSMLMPLLLVILMFSSCMAMTAESIAGEKERGTIATLLITPIKRSELALGKIAALSVMSLLGGLCSFTGVLLALPKLMGGEALGAVDASVYTVSDYAMILFIILSTILVFVSLIAVLSALANSVKEASTLISPLMLVVTVVGVSGMFTGGAQSNALFLIPVYNSVQCISGVFSMSYEPLQIILTVAANLATTGLFVVLLTRLFNNEKVMFKK
ncbi:MAG: ABC transporter permease [Clostridia bacterium]|nr:ABC transporter permease [Clostridia bacterium]